MSLGRLSRPSSLLLVLALSAGSAVPAWGGALRAWSTVGTAGTVDEADLDVVDLNGAVIGLKNGAVDTLNVRYHVVPVDGLFGGFGLSMIARLKDPDGSGQVVLRLKSMSLSTGEITSRLHINSNSLPGPVAGFQVGEDFDCLGEPDFEANAYFVEVEIRKTQASARPALAAISVRARTAECL